MEEATTAGLDANELKHVKVRGGGVGGYQDTGPGSCVCLVGDCLRILPWDSPQCKKKHHLGLFSFGAFFQASNMHI